MAKPYREGSGWAFRLRIKGEDIFRQGFKTRVEAQKAHDELRAQLKSKGRPAHQGPWRTTLAQALLNYGVERLPGLKGAHQEARRINHYLRLAGLPTLRPVALAADGQAGLKGVLYFRVELVPASPVRPVPQGLGKHRAAQSKVAQGADRMRLRLAHMPVAEVQPYDIEQLVDALKKQGLSAATIHLEVAPLRQLFNYAKDTWNWKLEFGNPAANRELPTPDNARDRVLTNEEWGRICEHLPETRNPYVAHALALLLESAMRCSEALMQICWQDLDREKGLLKLRAAKAGWRYVPLTLSALDVLRQLREHALKDGPIHPGMRIFRLSYEALKAAWNRVCERAGVQGVRLHDLRHTSATRFALELNGSMPVLKIITGHKTDSQLLRYINIKPDDVARLMQGRPLDHANAPAGLRVIRAEGVRVLPGSPEQDTTDLPENVVPLRRRLATP
jgi:integrase